MQLSYNVANHGNLFPAVYNHLRSLPDAVLQHGDHSLPHPLAIYNKSLLRASSKPAQCHHGVFKLFTQETRLPDHGDCPTRLSLFNDHPHLMSASLVDQRRYKCSQNISQCGKQLLSCSDMPSLFLENNVLFIKSEIW